MGRGRFLKSCTITPVGSYSDWKPAQISQWVNANGGQVTNKITNHTTHLVVHAKHWKNQTPMVREALQLNQDEDRDIKIVSFEWLDDSMRNRSKRHEKVYLWEKMDAKSMKKSQTVASTSHEEEVVEEDSEAEGSEEERPVKKMVKKDFGGPKNHVGMLAEVFHDSTEGYLNEEEIRKIDKAVELERRAQQELKDEERAEKKRALDELAKGASSFKKGSKKARNEIFSENHHIYVDQTNFSYDVLLTKVDTKHNRNERWALTIYESNTEPHSYAMNAQFAGTGKLPSNNVLAAIGCNFPTVFRQFKKTFKDRTGVNWDDRISHHAERTKREKRERGLGTGSETGTQRGVPVSESAAAAAAGGEDFVDAWFQYHPPSYGPRGVLPENREGGQPVQEVVTEQDAQAKERVEVWMSGANGAGPEEGEEVTESQVPADAQAAPAVDNGLDDFMDTFINDIGDGHVAATATQGMDGGFDDAFDYPFDNDDFFLQQGMLTDQAEDPTQQPSFDTDALTQLPSFDTIAAIDNSFEPGTQAVGETQLAERALGEFNEFINGPGYASGAHGGEMEDLGLPQSLPPSQLDLGSSALGKRKAVAAEEHDNKKAKGDEVADSFDDEGAWLSGLGGKDGNAAFALDVEEQQVLAGGGEPMAGVEG